MPKRVQLKVPRLKQKPFTCGPSSLQQVFAYYGIKKSINQLLKEIKLYKKGTFDGQLGLCALENGFKAIIIDYNLHAYDPTWFKLSKKALIKKLKQSLKHRKGEYKTKVQWLIKYFEAGGNIKFEIVTPELIKSYLKKKIPVIVCLMMTSLYKEKRRITIKQKKGRRSIKSDLKGKPAGHYLVVSGYDGDKLFVTDPYYNIPYSKKGEYKISSKELIASILMWNGSLLIIEKK